MILKSLSYGRKRRPLKRKTNVQVQGMYRKKASIYTRTYFSVLSKPFSFLIFVEHVRHISLIPVVNLIKKYLGSPDMDASKLPIEKMPKKLI